MSLLEEETKRDENSFDLEAGNYFSEEKASNGFGVVFNLKISDKAFDLSVKAAFDFEVTDDVITEEFKLSAFPRVNAPAIAFPYLRAFVSNLTLQSGLAPVVLPSINFVELADRKA